MKRIRRISALSLSLALLLFFSCACSEFSFSDERFRDVLTTENLNEIIEEYELFDGWYWTTEAGISQTFHGHPESPGWTSSVENAKRKAYRNGWFGCRWPIDRVLKTRPDQGGYAECFGFANFIGYLLSGELNPQHNWDFYYTTEKSGPLLVGDIVHVDYKKNGRIVQHSAVVYAVNGEEILFMQVSGGNYNRISIGCGFSDGNVTDAKSIEEISAIPGLKISRYIRSN